MKMPFALDNYNTTWANLIINFKLTAKAKKLLINCCYGDYKIDTYVTD